MTVTPRHPHVKDERTSGTGPKERVILHATWWGESTVPRSTGPYHADRCITYQDSHQRSIQKGALTE